MQEKTNNAASSLDKIRCPKCGVSFPISEALSHEIAEKAREKYETATKEERSLIAAKEAELQQREQSLAHLIETRLGEERTKIQQATETRVRAATTLEVEDLQRQNNEKAKQVEELQKNELEFRQQKRLFEQKEKSLETEMARKLDEISQSIRKEAEEQTQAKLSTHIRNLEAQTAEKDKKLKEASEAELKLLREKRELEEKGKQLELDSARKLDAERNKIREDAEKQAEERHRLLDAEKDKKLQDVEKANEELARKLRQGSQQTQGEVLELHVEELLRSAFPSDDIEAVGKGVAGADIIQHVKTAAGRECGIIVWETKRAKAWSEGWLSKLKENQRRVKADIGIVVTETLPSDCKGFGSYGGVWVANARCLLPLATALRFHLTDVATAKLAAVGKNEKMESIFHYLSGSEFRQRVEAIVEAFVEMQDDLAKERRAAETRWAKREKQIQKVISSTAGMYGDMQGLLGPALKAIPALDEDEAEQKSGSVRKRLAAPKSKNESDDEFPF